MTLLLAFFFILLQGFFSGSETAYIVAKPVRLIKGKGKRIFKILESPETVLFTTLIGTNISVVLSSMFFTQFFVEIAGHKGTTYAIICGAVLGLVFGEYLPKEFARNFAEPFVDKTFGIFNILTALFRPMNVLINKLSKRKEKGKRITKSELLSTVKLGESMGLLGKKTSPKFANIMKAFEFTAEDVMNPWDFVVKLKKGFTDEDVKRLIEEEGFSRYPVVDEKEEVVGIFHVKDLLFRKRKLRTPIFVHSKTRIARIFEIMQNAREHMVIVGEKRNPLGMITLEDILEEFVGEIRSED